jgi:hypothetical protein
MAVPFGIGGSVTPMTGEQATGNPSYFDALMRGLQGAQEVAKTVNTPRQLSENYLAAQLKNAHERTINKYLEPSEQARIANTQAQTGLYGEQSKYFGPNIQSEMDLRRAQAGLYGEQAQKAVHDLAFRKQMEERYFPSNKTQSYAPEELNQLTNQGQGALMSQPQIQQPGSMEQIQQPDSIEQIPPYARKMLGMPEEFPQEKMNREIYTSKITAQNKQDMEQAKLLKDTARELSLAGIDVNGIHDILTGPHSLTTGVGHALIGTLGFGSEKLGELNERAVRLQAQMTHALSARGGAQAAKIVASGKPGGWKGTSENLGLTKAYAERVKNEFDLINQEYKKITGEYLPYTLPEYVNNIGQKINEHSFKPKINFSNENEYHKYMQSLNPEQQKIAINAIKGASK